MPLPTRSAALERLAPGVRPVVLAHAQRGLNLQLVLRWVLVLFVGTTLALVPPDRFLPLSIVIAAAYAVAAACLTIWLRRGGRAAVLWGWLGLYVDLAALSTLSILAGFSDGTTWTAEVLQRGFFLLPVLAATQLRWLICASIVVPTVVIYTVDALVNRAIEDEPLASVVIRVALLAAVGGAAVGLSRIQRSRVTAIGDLVRDRTQLLHELMTVTDRERRSMAEHLHDGALQYVLGARHDLDDARDSGDPESFERLDRALTESAAMLRSTVSELHPAVLEQAGLAAAIRQLANNAAQRGGLDLVLDVDGWRGGRRTTTDLLLYGTAREMLANVVKHAHARSVRVALHLEEGRAVLTIADDGVGLDPTVLPQRLAEGHIGLDSHRVKVEAEGGSLRVETPSAGGTMVTVTVPVADEQDAAEAAPSQASVVGAEA